MQKHSFKALLYKDIDKDYTKRLINKIIIQLLDTYEDDFFMMHLHVIKKNKKDFKIKFSVEEEQGAQAKNIPLTNDTRDFISTICTILHAYNAYFEDMFKWNTMTIDLHFEGKYTTSRMFDSNLEIKKHKKNNCIKFNNIVELAHIRKQKAAKKIIENNNKAYR
ncbi:hypothetical protein [Agarilytica rhodophyticola]|uniref:hypothetical protein n=1 Tax=Agarilytica rhodophyticola TaxID=1737490 RepID=UPI000B344004|nr:hypothetical protein [Agarilytica rhodophyticola]